MEKTSLYQDSIFRKIVVGSTGLGLACMFASLAAIRINKSVGLQFSWHWSLIIVIAAAVFWNWRFWNVAWEAQTNPQPDSRRKLRIYLVVLALLGIAAFLYPIRFLEQSYWNGISRGLVTAGTFLGTMFTLIYKVGKGFGEIDAAELKAQEQPTK